MFNNFNVRLIRLLKYARLIFICYLQETTQQDPAVLVSQVAAEKKAARAEEARAEEARADDDADGTEDGDDDDAEDDNGGERATDLEPETESKKRMKVGGPNKTVKSEHFAETGATHALIGRATPFWNSSDTALTAVDIFDPASHDERLKGALAAVQAYNINGLRAQAPSIFVKNFMQHSMQQAASSANKVKTIYIHVAI
jgi:hypothetical protein